MPIPYPSADRIIKLTSHLPMKLLRFLGGGGGGGEGADIVFTPGDGLGGADVERTGFRTTLDDSGTGGVLGTSVGGMVGSAFDRDGVFIAAGATGETIELFVFASNRMVSSGFFRSARNLYVKNSDQ